MDKQAKFPGWPSGKGRAICMLKIPLQSLAKFLGVQVLQETGMRYVWRSGKVIGDYTIIDGMDDAPGFSQVIVDSRCDKVAAFNEVLGEVFVRLPQETPILLEDDYDYDRKMNS